MVDVPLERQVACVRREVSMRRRVYPRWVESGKMTQQEANRQIEAMEAVQATLQSLIDAAALMAEQRAKADRPELF